MNRINIGTMLMGAAAIGYAVWLTVRMNGLADNLGVKFNDLTDTLSDDVSDKIRGEMVNKAVNDAANRMVDERYKQIKTGLDECANKITADGKRAFQTSVDKAVKVSWNSVKDGILDKLLEEANKIDTKEVEREAVTQARNEIMEKVHDAVDEALTDIHDKYSEKLDEYMEAADEKFQEKLDEKFDNTIIKFTL